MNAWEREKKKLWWGRWKSPKETKNTLENVNKTNKWMDTHSWLSSVFLLIEDLEVGSDGHLEK